MEGVTTFKSTSTGLSHTSVQLSVTTKRKLGTTRLRKVRPTTLLQLGSRNSSHSEPLMICGVALAQDMQYASPRYQPMQDAFRRDLV